METRFCSKCKIEKPLTKDFFNTKDRLGKKFRTDCKECQHEKQSEAYQNKREIYKQAAKNCRAELRKENQKLLWNFFANNPCVRCGESNPISLELDHLFDKKYNISDIIYCHTWDSIYQEIMKCQVLCSNCHKRKTAKERKFYSYVEDIEKYL